jgi:signal transduction histidine kinase
MSPADTQRAHGQCGAVADVDVLERRESLRWLGQLRWWALGGALAGVILAMILGWTFVHTAAVCAGVAVMGIVNLFLVWRARRDRDVGRDELQLHAAVDLLFLTWLLAWSGGLHNPISVAFSFHVVLGALLNGRRGAIVATSLSIALIGALWLLETLSLLPVAPLASAPRPLLVLALGLLVVGLGYFAIVMSEQQAEVRRRLVAEQLEAKHSVTLLLDSLAALKVGLDLVGPDGASQLQNETARALKQHTQAQEAARVVDELPGDAAGSRTFAVPTGATRAATDRIIDLVALPASSLGGRNARARLYVDRTDELLVEQRHVMLERLATLGRAMQGVAHELNTPLTTMQTLAKDLRAALRDAPLDDKLRKDVEESLALLVEESQRCRALTQALLSRADDGRRPNAPQTLFEIARRAVRLVAPAEEGEAVQLDERSLALTCPVDNDRVLQVVMNLVQNALRATVDLKGDGKGARVVVDAANVDDKTIRVRIADRGPGLPDEVRARLFEPFVTTRPVGEGTGLGLYTSQRIVREMGGSLALDDGATGGTVATLTLPRRA